MVDFLFTAPAGQSHFAVLLAKVKSSESRLSGKKGRRRKRESEAKNSTPSSSSPFLSFNPHSSLSLSLADGVAVYQELRVFCLSSYRPHQSSSSFAEDKSPTGREKEERDEATETETLRGKRSLEKGQEEEEEEGAVLLLPPIGRATAMESETEDSHHSISGTQLAGVYVHLVWSREIMASKTVEKTVIAGCFSSPPPPLSLCPWEEESLSLQAGEEATRSLLADPSSWPTLHLLTGDFQLESTRVPPYSPFALCSSSPSKQRVLSDAAVEKGRKATSYEEEDQPEEEEEEFFEGDSPRKLQQFVQIHKAKQKIRKEEEKDGHISSQVDRKSAGEDQETRLRLLFVCGLKHEHPDEPYI